MLEVKKKNLKGMTCAVKDLLMLLIVTIFVFIFSYFFSVFTFLVKIFQENPDAITYVDETISVLLTVSIGLAVFAWRRWLELKKETAERLRLEEEIVGLANTKAETERIIAKQLRNELEYHKKIETDLLKLTQRQK